MIEHQRSSEIVRLAEDATGFGVTEMRTGRDLLWRPSVVLDAWMTDGSQLNGRYVRPLRFYILLSGFLMLVMFLRDGGVRFMEGFPPASIDALALQAGKSRDEFISDADSWMSLVLVPVTCIFYPAVATPLLRWWDPARLGWRGGLRATFGYLAAWTLPILPLSWWSYEGGPVGAAAGLAIFLISVITFVRMGKGRWSRNWLDGLWKGMVLSLALYASSVVALIPILAVSLIGAVIR